MLPLLLMPEGVVAKLSVLKGRDWGICRRVHQTHSVFYARLGEMWDTQNKNLEQQKGM